MARSFIVMLDDLSQEQLMALPTMAPDTFLYIMRACEQGVESSDTFIRSHACSAISNIASFVVRETERREYASRRGSSESSGTVVDESVVVSPGRRRSSNSPPGTHWLMTYLTQFPTLLPSVFVTVFNLVLFDDNQDQWSLSRPLYALMLLQKEASKLFL